MDSESKDLYFVAVKVFLRDGDNLLITHDIFGAWDLPGGRIKKDEFNTKLEDVITRKMREEIGDDVKYELGQVNGIFFRVERKEAGLNNKPVRIFAVGYDAEYLSGKVKLGDHHDKFEWVNIKNFKPEDYFTGGWLLGVQEYLDEQA
jgi:ADP-ribose pyrophosphatase YjhB (NUDIX family)